MVEDKMKIHNIKGSLEKKVLHHLALNPHQLIKPISKVLNKDYKATYYAVFNLKKKGFITEGKLVEQKGREFQSYKLTDRGVAYVLVNNNIDLKKVMKKYSTSVSFLEYYIIFGSQLKNPKLLEKFVKAGAAIHLKTLEEKEIDYTFLLASMAVYLMQDFTEKERQELIKAVLVNPELQRNVEQLIEDTKRVEESIKTLKNEIKKLREEREKPPKWIGDWSSEADREHLKEKMREFGRKVVNGKF